MAERFIFTMAGLTKSFGAKALFENIHLQFYAGAKIGIVGRNGTGKSTLLRIMAGEDKDFSGEAYAAEGLRIGYLPQEPRLDPARTVRENVTAGLGELQEKLDAFNAIAEEMAENYTEALMERMAVLQEELDAADAWTLDQQVDMAMQALGCPEAKRSAAQLSGGETRRVALARLLLSQPDLLLLDEPTNHLDVESISWLEHYLRDYPGAVILVTHDRYFLDRVTGWILEIDKGKGYPFKGNYQAWLRAKSDPQSGAGEEERWLYAQEIAALEQRAGDAAGSMEKRHRMIRDSHSDEVRRQTKALHIPPGPALGGKVIEAEGLGISRDGRVLMSDVSFSLPPAGIVGIIGPNGAGKSTLLGLLAQEEKPQKGSLRFGETVRCAHAGQSRAVLEDTQSVYEAITGGNDLLLLGDKKVHGRAYCGWFNFKGGDQQKKLAQLSGGERNRVLLAQTLRSGANLLLLDEPTNDLDMETLRSLEAALEAFPGCVVVVSHDRWFLDRLATHILAFEGNGHVEWFAGNNEAYRRDKARRTGESEDLPNRLKYRRFSQG